VHNTQSFIKLDESKNSVSIEVVEIKKPGKSFVSTANMAPETFSMGAPPKYMVDREDTLNHAWWNVKYWGKKGWFIFAGVVVVILIIIGVAAGVTARNNRYPTYSKLTYSLAENCMFPHFPLPSDLDNS